MQQLLLLPLLAPLLAVLLVGALNPRPAVALRLLTWTSAALPLGAWIAGAAAAGAGFSALTSALALRQGAETPVRPGPRSVHRRPVPPPGKPPASTVSAGPSRGPAEPAPTVEVPFRVIRRGSGSNSNNKSNSSSGPTPRAEPQAAARAVGDGWDEPLSDDWS